MSTHVFVCVYMCVCVYTDDMLIKLWDWDKKWACTQVFEGHSHYVMQIVINPKDNNQFASASLDRSIKVGCLTPLVLGRVTAHYDPKTTKKPVERTVLVFSPFSEYV